VFVATKVREGVVDGPRTATDATTDREGVELTTFDAAPAVEVTLVTTRVVFARS